MNQKVLIAGPASSPLVNSLSNLLNLPIFVAETKTFSDGETKVRIDAELQGKNAILVQSTYPPTDQHIIQLLMIAHHLSQEGAKVFAVIPYLAYARQDKQFLPGEIVSLGVVSHLIRSVGVSRVITVDIHSAEGLSLFSIPIYSVSAIPVLVRYVKENSKLQRPLVVAPDFGASKRVEAFATLYGAEHVQFSKERDRVTGEVKIESSNIVIKKRDVVILDDIIISGHTIKGAAEILQKAGARRIWAVCVHALLVGEAYDMLRRSGIDEIVSTNTVPSQVSKVDVAEPIASYLNTLGE
jgi:ribose-phosphate pyrophosphokinase